MTFDEWWELNEEANWHYGNMKQAWNAAQEELQRENEELKKTIHTVSTDWQCMNIKMNKALRVAKIYMEANEHLVAAIDRIHDVLNNEEHVKHSDIGIEKIINKALDKNREALTHELPKEE